VNTKSFISGYAIYASADELVPTAEVPGGTPTVTTSSAACISAVSATTGVSIDNTFDHGC
jgi:hypothetical protein